MKKGTRVKFRTKDMQGKLGVMEYVGDTKFIGTLGRDFTGIYEGPHPTLDDWHIVSVVARAVEPANEWCEERMNERGRDHRYIVPTILSRIEPVDDQPSTSSLSSLLP